jgi:transposase
MRLQISKTKNAASLYVVRSTYVNGKHSSEVVEKLGTLLELQRKLGDRDPIAWAEEYVKELTAKEKAGRLEIIAKFSPAKGLEKGERRSFNGGYMFLQQIYHELGVDKICKGISERHGFEYDIDSILSRLVYARILFPASKLATSELAAKFIEQPNFELQHIYRALDVIEEEMDFIQSSIYHNSLKMTTRNTNVLYYDCTNYFFETEQEEGLRQYGYSKEHRPNPIVEMGLFMDGDGIPLAFNINAGNTNEQVTLQPLERKILSDFALSRIVVCTDAGLASKSNRMFNDIGERGFITTQSIKLLDKPCRDWTLNPEGWRIPGDKNVYNLTKIDEEKYREVTFYKEKRIKDDKKGNEAIDAGFEQRLIVTYSIKYKDYQRGIRASQAERAQKTIENNPTKLKKSSPNDYKRLIKKTSVTTAGEVASKAIYGIDDELIAKEEAFDGFYGVCTNLEDSVSIIMEVNQRRWEIEECFRIMKSEFKARPVYLRLDDRIKAHFMTCFISLILYRLLEKKLGYKYTCHEIITQLRDMNFLEIKGAGYVPTYTRTDFTDDLHEAFGFRTDYQIIDQRKMKNILKLTHKPLQH